MFLFYPTRKIHGLFDLSLLVLKHLPLWLHIVKDWLTKETFQNTSMAFASLAHEFTLKDNTLQFLQN